MTERLVELLEASPGEFVSGEEISEKLSISRTAVWKRIEKLREEGYRFEAVPRRGYRLIGKPDKLDPAALAGLLQTEVFGRRIHYYQEVDSTQTAALALLAEGAPEGTLVVAERQTAGRGRQGRPWISPKGKGLWMSLVLKPSGLPISCTPQLTLLVAVALSRAVRAETGLEAGIKWPNDLLIGGRKISGILLESRAEDASLQHIIAGVGISVNLTAEDYPEGLQETATSLAIEAGRPIDRPRLLTRFLFEWEQLYRLYMEQGFAPIKLLWEALTISLHRTIRCRTPQGFVEGYGEGIDEFGALLLRLPDGTIRRLISGDVEFR
ncbi:MULTISPECIES: biotin--[acetyl-CoA-carboxylase] ligase [Paenibacillus]|uniref:biotin--[acetyl-CoA-carboxylase] ligase n=1 Tax=Paenibacillus TaxID=44249 RepID=UPI0022B91086|nr:biotin--[acetyl-CoA-carboxylase] ligase [Paenibacillus caseinilyticus]MCZ8520501.1 biotin--[acetyl-CoA-carboxylase] ligase [Paenibacillus caseinilyticus]